MYTLQSKLKSEHFKALQFLFPQLNLSDTKVKYVEGDGKLGRIAFVSGTIFGYPNEIWLDESDWEENRPIDPTFELEGLVICHELIHLEQASRGLWARIRMWWARQTQDYEDRWQEKEAHERDGVLLGRWKSLLRRTAK